MRMHADRRALRRAALRRALRGALAGVLPLALAVMVTSRSLGAQGRSAPATRPWLDARRPVRERARLLLARMTPEEKFWQLFMSPGDPVRDSAAFVHGAYGVQLLDLREPSAGGTAAAAARADSVQRFFVERTRLGIPAILFEEGVHGLMQAGATVFPQAIALAATWDTALVGGVAREIARQARDRGIRQLLAPVVNLARDPRWGRVEETYGEDSWLSAAMGAAYVRGLEGNGVVATPKHFVANHGDGGRDSYPVSADDATLEDLHLPPFRAAIVGAGARAVMASYNSVNGVPASASRRLLTEVLRRQWNFTGVVISDAGGVGGANVLHHTSADYAESTARALRAGLDVIFQGSVESAPLFRAAITRGLVPAATLDRAVLRVLRLKFALGLFEHPFARPGRSGSLMREMDVAVASLVLLRNERRTLPLSPLTRRIALIGEDAVAMRTGGYSVRPVVEKSLAAALRARLRDSAAVRTASGPGLGRAPWVLVPPEALTHDSAGRARPGLSAEYFANAALTAPASSTRIDPGVDASYSFLPPAPGLSTDWFSVRWTGEVRVPADAPVRVAVEGDDGYRLWLDDTLVVDGEPKVSFGTRSTRTTVRPGVHRLRLEYRQTTGTGRVRLLWDAGVHDDAEARIIEAVDATRGADVAIVTVRVDEGEFRDRSTLRLPGRQEALIARLADTGVPLVVLIVAGGAVNAAPWLERAEAVMQAMYPGDSAAEAITQVLFGDVAPGGRLPFTVPRSDGQLPLVYDHLPTGRGDDYVDLTGQPLFPFGYGLTYVPFDYSGLEITGRARSMRDTVHVTAWVRNMERTPGRIAGDEVVQLYVRHMTAPTAQPVLSLRGFARVSLSPGEGRRVQFDVPAAALFVRDERGARVPPTGPIEFFVGASSRDIRLRGVLTTAGGRP
jgi:beta-glucosidase